MAYTRVLGALVAAAFVASCSGDGSTGPEPKPEPLPQPGIRVVAGPSTSDTIGATPAQALVVEVRGPEGRVAPGVVVRFSAAAVPAAARCFRVAGDCWEKPSMWVGDPAGSTFSEAGSAAVTGTDGRASVRIRFGGLAGTGRIAVTVPELGMQDTTRFEIRAGAGVKAIAEPHDTAVTLGAGFAARGLVVDRWGNPRPETASVAVSGGPGLRVEGRNVGSLEYGVHALIAQSPGLLGDTTRMTVVPRGTLAAVNQAGGQDSLVIVDLDGTNRRAMPTGQFVDGLDWMPDGSGLLVSVGLYAPPRRLYVYAADGSRKPFTSGDTLSNQAFPVFTADGQWVFFIGPNNGIWRARRDGSAVEHLPLPGVLALDLGPSPDGSRVIVNGMVPRAPIDDFTRILVLETGTGRTTTFPFKADAFRWSQAADLLAFGIEGVLGVARPDGSGVRRFLDVVNSEVSHFDLSPDGRWIVYRDSYFLELIEVETGRRIPLRHIPPYRQVAWKS